MPQITLTETESKELREYLAEVFRVFSDAGTESRDAESLADRTQRLRLTLFEEE